MKRRDSADIAKQFNLQTADHLSAWGKTMKAITICQPYAELISRGMPRHPLAYNHHPLKPFENRTWWAWKQGVTPPAVLVIHAGKGQSWWTDEYGIARDSVAWGAAVAIAHLIECVAVGDLPKFLASQPKRFAWMAANKHAQGPICWIFERVQRLRHPVPMRGGQGIWECNPNLITPEVTLCPTHGTPFCDCPSSWPTGINLSELDPLPRGEPPRQPVTGARGV